MNKIIIFAIITVVIIVLSATVVFWSHTPLNYFGKKESITIGAPLNETSALLYIAEGRQFFAVNGLNIKCRDYDFGSLALNSMLREEVDIALATEYPLVVKAFEKEKVRTIGSIGKFEFVYLVGRKDRGIKTISDLKGKSIATARWTIAEFYLGRYLNLHGIKIEEIILGDLQRSEQLMDAVVKGDVAAVVTQEPYVALAAERLGTDGVVWPVQNGQAMFAPLICRADWITKHPELVARLLSSLAQAEEYASKHPVEAEAIIQKRLNLKPSYAKTVRQRNQLSLSLDQSLIAAMEDEARWMILNKLTAKKTVPDFLEYIYEDGLKAIKPGAVNIIR